jgi:osmoprotectant transport system ATP-binding protein
MRKKIFTAPETKKTLECIELMKNREIDSVVVVDANDRFKGVVTIEKIKEHGKPGEEISKIVDANISTVFTTDKAKDSFDLLVKSKAGYIVVLNSDKTVAGIITRTSMAKALASVVWGDAS